MIQRIQSVYMFLAFICSGVLSLVFPLWTTVSGHNYYVGENPLYPFAFGLSATLSIIALLSYKKRQQQFVYNRLNIILNFILLGFIVYLSLNLSGEFTVSEKGIGMFLPLVSIILLALANKAIKKDENLVKSADRIR